MMNLFARLRGNDRGATAIEYGLIAALIAVASVTAIRGIGVEIGTTFEAASEGFAAANS